MSGTYPTSPVFNAVNFRSKWYFVMSEAISGRTQARNMGGHRWEFTAKYPTLSRAEFQIVDAFLEKQQGAKETFTIVLPVISEQSGDASGTILVNGAQAIGDTAIDVDGITGTLKAGDTVKFGHDKVYKITDDRAGNGVLNIQPPLVAALANNEPVVYDDVPFTVRQSGRTQEFEVAPGPFYSYEVDFIEAP